MHSREVRDHPFHGLTRRLHQVGRDTGGGVVSGGGRARALERLRHVELRRLHGDVASHGQAQRYGHRGFDRGAAHLAVALRRMRVAGAEQRAVHLHGQVQRRAGAELTSVQIAADTSWRDDAVQPRLRRSNAENPAERLHRHADAVIEDGS